MLRGQRVVVSASGADAAFLRGRGAEHVLDARDGCLAELSMLAAAGVFSLRVADTVALADAASAHRRLERGGVRGRLVLVPNQDRDSSP